MTELLLENPAGKKPVGYWHVPDIALNERMRVYGENNISRRTEF